MLEGFIVGVVITLFLVYQATRNDRHYRKLSPLHNPSGEEEARLLRVIEAHLHEVRWRQNSRPSIPFRHEAVVLHALQSLQIQDGVIYFERGIATLSDGTRVDLGSIARNISNTLDEVYRALFEASALVTDYATNCYKSDELLQHSSPVLRGIAGHGSMYPFQPIICQVAQLLQQDPDDGISNSNGKELWQRIRGWRRP